jgi:hypothetical protein
VRDLPTDFELNEAMAMSPGMSIAQYPELVVAARVSKTGSATPAAGDSSLPNWRNSPNWQNLPNSGCSSWRNSPS